MMEHSEYKRDQNVRRIKAGNPNISDTILRPVENQRHNISGRNIMQAMSL